MAGKGSSALIAILFNRSMVGPGRMLDFVKALTKSKEDKEEQGGILLNGSMVGTRRMLDFVRALTKI
jgi:hypothetical protein